MKPILVAIDGSEGGAAAADQAAQLASRLCAPLALLYVVSAPAFPAPLLGTTHRDLTALLARFGQEVLERTRTRCARPGLEISVHTAEGDPATQILRAAESLDAELIVVGTHGKPPLSQMFLGSVSYRVVHSSKRPVLVAR